MQHLVVLTGPPGSGKTTVCSRLAASAREAGFEIAGLLTTPLPADGASDVRGVVDLSTGEERPLARRDASPGGGPRRWTIDADAAAWGARSARRKAPGADVLFVDEVGPLELLDGAGWVECLDLVRSSHAGLTVVVVRPALVERFRAAVGDASSRMRVIEVTPDNRDRLPSILLELA